MCGPNTIEIESDEEVEESVAVENYDQDDDGPVPAVGQSVQTRIFDGSRDGSADVIVVVFPNGVSVTVADDKSHVFHNDDAEYRVSVGDEEYVLPSNGDEEVEPTKENFLKAVDGYFEEQGISDKKTQTFLLLAAGQVKKAAVRTGQLTNNLSGGSLEWVGQPVEVASILASLAALTLRFNAADASGLPVSSF